MKNIQYILVSVVCIALIISSITIAAPHKPNKVGNFVEKAVNIVKSCFTGNKSSNCNKVPNTYGQCGPNHGEIDHHAEPAPKEFEFDVGNVNPHSYAEPSHDKIEHNQYVSHYCTDSKSAELDQTEINNPSAGNEQENPGETKFIEPTHLKLNDPCTPGVMDCEDSKTLRYCVNPGAYIYGPCSDGKMCNQGFCVDEK